MNIEVRLRKGKFGNANVKLNQNYQKNRVVKLWKKKKRQRRMKMHVCDICKRNKADAKIKYKYRAIKAWYSFFGCGWDEIELCQDCLDKIIEADKAESEE